MEVNPPHGLINLNHANDQQMMLNQITIKNEYPALNIDDCDNDHNGEEIIGTDLGSIQEYQRQFLDSEEMLLNDNHQEDVNKQNHFISGMSKNSFKNHSGFNYSKKRKINYKLTKKIFPVSALRNQYIEGSIIKKEISNIDILSPEVELGVDNLAELPETLHSYNNSTVDDDVHENLLEEISSKTSKKSRKSKLLDSMLEPGSEKLRCRCKICNKQFNALSNLRRHISMFHYRARRFGCTFCEYRAFRRYDIINHLISVHKMSAEDKEMMSVQFVSVYDVPYTNIDMEGDIILVTDTNEIVDEGPIMNACRKRIKRSRATVAKHVVCNEKDLELLNEMQSETEKQSSLEKQAETVEKPADEIVAEKSTIVQAEGKAEGEEQIKNEKVDQVAVNQEKEERKKCNRTRKRLATTIIETDDQSGAESSIISNRSRSRRNVSSKSQSLLNSSINVPVKITRYRLRSDPLLPAKKSLVKDCAKRVYRNVVARGKAAPSTMPDIPTERPQMRPRLTSICYRSDAPSVPVIDSSDLKAASLKAEILDDTFLHKVVNNSNASFRLKPLLPLQQSPLKAILQKFDVPRVLNRNRSNINVPLESDNHSSNSSQRESSEESTTISNKIIDKLSAKVMLSTKAYTGNKKNSDNCIGTSSATFTENEDEKDTVNDCEDITDNNVKDSVGKLMTPRIHNGRHQKISTSIEQLLMLGKKDANLDLITPVNKPSLERDNPPVGAKKQRVSLIKRLGKTNHDDNIHSEIEQ